MHLFHLIFIFCFSEIFDIVNNIFSNVVRLIPYSWLEINTEKWDFWFKKCL